MFIYQSDWSSVQASALHVYIPVCLAFSSSFRFTCLYTSLTGLQFKLQLYMFIYQSDWSSVQASALHVYIPVCLAFSSSFSFTCLYTSLLGLQFKLQLYMFIYQSAWPSVQASASTSLKYMNFVNYVKLT